MIRLLQHCFTKFLIIATIILPASSQTIAVTLGKPEPLPKGIFGFNTNLLTATAFQGITVGGSEFENAVRELRPHSLRFPGGTIANNYRWQEDSFSAVENDLTKWAGEQIRLFRKMGRPYDLPGFARVCSNFDLQPIWVLNVFEETPETVVGLLERLGELDLDVRMIELGNEPYWDWRSINNVKKYIAFCKPLVAALRKAKPNLKIGACFAPLHAKFDYQGRWNAVLAREDWFDAIIFHEYYGGQGFALEKGADMPMEAMLRPEALIDEPVKVLTELLPGKPIWFTEWNIGTKGLKEWKNTGAELLFLGAIYSRLIDHRKAIPLAVFHQIYGTNFGTYFYDKDAAKIETNASYELFKMLGAAFADAEELRAVEFGGEESLCGFSTQRIDGIRLFVVNRGADEQSLLLPSELPEGYRRFTLSCPPEKMLPRSTGLIERHPVGRVVAIPSYSISLLVREDALRVGENSLADKNLFPVRPYFSLWYPPFARKQPRVDAKGVYTVALGDLAGKRIGIIKMELKPLGLESGGRYSLSFEMKSNQANGVTVSMPEKARGNADKTSPSYGVWTALTPNFKMHRFIFKYNAEINEGKFSLFISKEAIAKGGQLVLRKCKLVRL